MDNLSIGHFIGSKEDICNEYKELRLNKVKFNLSEEEIKHMINFKLWDYLIQLSIENLKTYINEYIPKYLVGFVNSKIKHGTLYFGVSDIGEIIGIPVTDKILQTNIIKMWIYNVIYKLVKYDNITVMIDIIKLEYDKSIVSSNIKELLFKILNKHKKYNEVMNEYKSKKMHWLDSVLYYKRKMNKIINETDMRADVINFIHNAIGYSDDIKNKIIDRLKDSEPISFDIGQISNEKYSIDSIAFWITYFRDHKILELNDIKPKRPMIAKPELPYFTILRWFYPIIIKMAKVNIPIIIIKITFNINKFNDLLSYNGKYIYRTLTSNGEPCCISSSEKIN